MNRRALTLAGLTLLAGAVTLPAQFGGGAGDVVIMVLTHRGPMDFTPASPLASNTAAVAARFRVTNTSTLPFEPVVPGFTQRRAQTLVRDPDDLFQMITQSENSVAPRAEFITRSKTLTLRGLLRDENLGGRGPLDVIPGNFATFTPGITVGPDLALAELTLVLWRPDANVLPYREVPNDYVGPAVPRGSTGPEFLVNNSKVPLFIRWEEMRKVHPTGGWPSGIDLKLLENDPSIPSTVKLLRLRAGKRMPAFSLPARTHLFVLQGNVDIAAPGATPTRMGQYWHAYLPANMIVNLSNPKEYTGPGSTAR